MKKIFKLISIIICISILCSACSSTTNNKYGFFESLAVSSLEDDSDEFLFCTLPGAILGAFSYGCSINDIIDDNTYICSYNDKYNYAVIKFLNPVKYLFVLYNKNDDYIKSSIYTSKFFKKSDFNNINVNKSTINDVMQIDNTMQVYSLDDDWLFSIHWLKNGDFIYIEYDVNSNVISNIDITEDNYKFYNILSKSDEFSLSEITN